jgi:hypothetical protein
MHQGQRKILVRKGEEKGVDVWKHKGSPDRKY